MPTGMIELDNTYVIINRSTPPSITKLTLERKKEKRQN